MRKLKQHNLFEYTGIVNRKDYNFPNQSRLAVYLGFNVEHFDFAEGLGASLGPPSPQPDVLNYSWREYGNRVGAWRCLELFDKLEFPSTGIINTALYDHCPELIQAMARRGYELIGHGHTNSERQAALGVEAELDLMIQCRETIKAHSAQTPKGWLSPWLSESLSTSELLAQSGYEYTLNWCHDDQPVLMKTKANKTLWSIPYPQELNDIPMIIARQMDAKDFAQIIIDQFDEMYEQCDAQPLVMGIALHPYIVGQPYRLRYLRRALEHIASFRDSGKIWLTTPGRICDYMNSGNV
jgi:peptidoglycan/xylan/chitin deacetylase (PgdA/CDA1 family)